MPRFETLPLDKLKPLFQKNGLELKDDLYLAILEYAQNTRSAKERPSGKPITQLIRTQKRRPKGRCRVFVNCACVGIKIGEKDFAFAMAPEL